MRVWETPTRKLPVRSLVNRKRSGPGRESQASRMPARRSGSGRAESSRRREIQKARGRSLSRVAGGRIREIVSLRSPTMPWDSSKSQRGRPARSAAQSRKDVAVMVRRGRRPEKRATVQSLSVSGTVGLAK
jgi:hypothetical protein